MSAEDDAIARVRAETLSEAEQEWARMQAHRAASGKRIKNKDMYLYVLILAALAITLVIFPDLLKFTMV